MKPANDIRRFFGKATVRTNSRMDETVLDLVLTAHDKSTEKRSALVGPGIRSMTMRNPIARFAVAAVVIAAVVLGVFELVGVDGGGTSGVVWAEVARKVQASRGVIFRKIEHIVPDTYGQGVDFDMDHYSRTQARLDGYKGGEIVKTIYDDCSTKTVILVDHIHKSYVKMTAEEMPDSHRMVDPNNMVQRFLSCEHKELGQKTIDGVLCEGIETTDPAFHGGDHPPESLMARIWVSVETGYPVQIEREYVRDNGERRFDSVQDQFQWDVELDESIFEPNIPVSYIDISPDEW